MKFRFELSGLLSAKNEIELSDRILKWINDPRTQSADLELWRAIRHTSYRHVTDGEVTQEQTSIEGI